MKRSGSRIFLFFIRQKAGMFGANFDGEDDSDGVAGM